MTISRREDQWADWMRAAIAGDTKAYHQFLSAVAPHLRAMAARRCDRFGASRGEVEDVVQEVLLAIHLKRGSWDQSRPIGPWISTLVRNKLIDSLRRRGRHIDVPIDEVAEILQAPGKTDADTEKSDILKLVEQLKDPQRIIVRSVSLEGWSIRETAAHLQMTDGAVRVALHRALRTLANLYRGNAVSGP